MVLPPPDSVGGVDVRGGGPATRETDALGPTALVDAVHAFCLTGGSAYGLAAADGVMDWLGERAIGFEVGAAAGEVVPIVGAAALFDLGAGGVFAHRPDAAWGRAAAAAASGRRIRQGCVGAGTGARTGPRTGLVIKGGIGSASVVLPDGVVVAALVAVNAGGGVVDEATGELYGLRFGLPGEFDHVAAPSRADVAANRSAIAPMPEGQAPPRHTVLAVVATDAVLTKSGSNRMAVAGHDGMARAVRPIHAMTDGDVVFSFATGRRVAAADHETTPGELSVLMAAAADTVTRAIAHGVLAARTAGGSPSYFDRYSSARR